MKRVLTTLITLALLCACMMPAAFAAGIDLTYDLTVDGSNSATVQTGDIITVTYTIHGSGDYDVNAIQNEIKFDDSFFELVESSITAEKGVGQFVPKIAGPRVYMNDINNSYDAEQTVGSFQMKVIATSGSSTVESTECLAYDGNGDAMTVTNRNLTVTIAGSSPVDPGTPEPPDIPDEPDVPDKPAVPDTPDKPETPSTPSDPGSPATPEAKRFEDVADGAWYKDAVDFVSGRGLFNGVSETRFAPEMTMTRAMLVTVLYRLEGEPGVTAANIFSDVANGMWYTDAVIWANANKIVEGYGNGLFGSEDEVTREQMATILYRYMQYLGMDVSARGSLNAFTDGNQVSSWALEGMQWAVGSGIITGKDGGVLDPTGTATRAEVATMLMRLVDLIDK